MICARTPLERRPDVPRCWTSRIWAVGGFIVVVACQMRFRHGEVRQEAGGRKWRGETSGLCQTHVWRSQGPRVQPASRPDGGQQTAGPRQRVGGT